MDTWEKKQKGMDLSIQPHTRQTIPAFVHNTLAEPSRTTGCTPTPKKKVNNNNNNNNNNAIIATKEGDNFEALNSTENEPASQFADFLVGNFNNNSSSSSSTVDNNTNSKKSNKLGVINSRF